MMWVYVIINHVNGKLYVGQTGNDPKWRWNRHLRDASLPFNPRDLLVVRAIRKYGKRNFSVYFIPVSGRSQERLNFAEIDLINRLNTRSPSGYNIKEGGSNGKHSKKTKNKMSRARKGKKLSPMHIESISRGRKGKHFGPLSKSHKDAISKSERGRIPWNKGIKDARTGRKGRIPWNKGKTYIELLGKDKAAQMRVKISTGQVGRTSPMKGKSYEEIYGLNKAKQIKSKIGSSEKSEEMRLRMSIAQIRRFAREKKNEF